MLRAGSRISLPSAFQTVGPTNHGERTTAVLWMMLKRPCQIVHIPDYSSGDWKGSATDSWQFERGFSKMVGSGRSECVSTRHISITCEWPHYAVVHYHRAPFWWGRRQWRIQKFWRGGVGRQCIRPRRHLSRMHTTNHMPFIREKTAYLKNSEPIRGWGRPHPTPLNSPLVVDLDKCRCFAFTVVCIGISSVALELQQPAGRCWVCVCSVYAFTY